MPKKAPRIPDETWDQHKEAIIAFYSGNPLDRTMKYMVEEYGFQARYKVHFLAENLDSDADVRLFLVKTNTSESWNYGE